MTAVIVNILLVCIKRSRHDGPGVILCFLAVASFPVFADRTAFVDFHRIAKDDGVPVSKADVDDAWLRVRGTYARSGSVNNVRGVLHTVCIVYDVKYCTAFF